MPVTGLPLGTVLDKIDAAWSHSCAVDDNSTLYCWGSYSYGQLGVGQTSTTLQPTPTSLPLCF